MWLFDGLSLPATAFFEKSGSGEHMPSLWASSISLGATVPFSPVVSDCLLWLLSVAARGPFVWSASKFVSLDSLGCEGPLAGQLGS